MRFGEGNVYLLIPLVAILLTGGAIVDLVEDIYQGILPLF